MSDLNAIRARARGDLHSRAAVDASYLPPLGPPALAVRVRVHRQAMLVSQGGGTFERIELESDQVALVFQRAELDAPEVGAEVTITGTGEVFVITRLLAPTTLEASAVVEHV